MASDIKDIFAEAKSAGFDIKVLRQLIKIRKQEAAEVEEQETLLDVYRRALGMVLDAFDRPDRLARGNPHTHSTRSDGARIPRRVCELCREAG